MKVATCKSRAKLLAVFLTCAILFDMACCFSSLPASTTTYYATTRQQKSRSITEFYGCIDDREEGHNDDIEAARDKLEALLGGSQKQQHKKEKEQSDEEKSLISLSDLLEGSISTPAAPLTTTARANKQREIDLLASLATSDESLPELWSLWFSERGPVPAKQLLKAKALADRGPKFWDKAEEDLLQLITAHGSSWVEPINGLATLFYVQGRLKESKILCEIVLEQKPWHFGALSGVVLVCAGLGDSVTARMWADRRLPPITPRILPTDNTSDQLREDDDDDDDDSSRESPRRRSNSRFFDATTITERRKAWVERAVQEASLSLLQAEKQTKEAFFGQRDDLWAEEQEQHLNSDYDDEQQSNLLDDENAWG